MKVKILRKKDGSFEGSDGNQVSYFWYRFAYGENYQNRAEFGSVDGSHQEGDEPDLDLYREDKKGRLTWKEETH